MGVFLVKFFDEAMVIMHVCDFSLLSSKLIVVAKMNKISPGWL